MAQLFLLSLLIFAIVCTFYGISAGVQRIQHGCARLFGGLQPASPAQQSYPGAGAQATSQATQAQRCLDELEGLHTLRQKGALSEAEFDAIKQQLLASLGQKPNEAQGT